MKMKTLWSKICGMQQKQFQEGKFIAIQTYLRKPEKLK